jgi:Protein of unknown function (DUF2818)
LSTFALTGLAFLVIAIVLANLPFLNERYFVLIKPKADHVKGLGFRFLELLVYYALTIGCGVFIEGRVGQIQTQRWEFYGITACLFIVLAYPGFVIKYLKKSAARDKAPTS